MDHSDTISAFSPLLRHRALRMLLVASPGITAAVAILTATESNLAWVVVLNLSAGIIISSALFLAISMVARHIADERVQLAQATEQEVWRARAQRLSIHNGDTGLYADWYFRLRLQEETERSKRYGLHFAVLLVKPMGLHQDTELGTATAWFGEHIQRHLRRSDRPALLQDGSLGVVMPNTGHRAAREVLRRITAELAALEPKSGLACFPDDSTDVTQLLILASQNAAEQAKPGPAAASPRSAPHRRSPRKRRASTASEAASQPVSASSS